MGMKSLETLKDKLCEELEKIAKTELSAGSLETIHKITDTIKNIDKITMLEDGGEGYSKDAGMHHAPYSRDSYGRGGNSYGGDDSYGRGGSYDSFDSYDSRDSYRGRRGHYVRGHYSRADGRDEMMHRMGEMMTYAENDRQREAIERCMRQLEQM